MTTALQWFLWVTLGALLLPALLSCLYLLSMTLLSAALPPPPRSARVLRFDVIVPAHNEAAVLERTLASLRRMDWPADNFHIMVVADNCTDNTAALACAAGATVLERHDPQRRGKGYALELACNTSVTARWADAVVIVDADSEVSANLLEAIATRIESGAAAVQAHYGVLNPHASWRTQLLTIAMALIHIVRGRGRERLGVSCGIRGNGWALTHDLLQRVPYRAYSLAEDIEYGLTLGLAGVRVAYADEATVFGEMVSGAAAAGQQRQRWERGRLQLLRSHALPLLSAAVRRRSALCLDLALDLLVLPLAYVALNLIVVVLLAALLGWWLPSAHGLLWLALCCWLALTTYVLRGWQLSGVGWRGCAAFARAPGFMIWKVALLLRPSGATADKPLEWVRTDRESS